MNSANSKDTNQLMIDSASCSVFQRFQDKYQRSYEQLREDSGILLT